MERQTINQPKHQKNRNNKEPPKIFWKFYDLYRRGQITIEEYRNLSGLPTNILSLYLRNI